MHQLDLFIEPLSLSIGLVGVAIIVMGAVKAIAVYLQGLFQRGLRRVSHNFGPVRTTLNGHLIVGLDFLVAKDIIDTMLLHSGENFWMDLIRLFTIVVIRIILSYFLERELTIIDSAGQASSVSTKTL